MLNQPYTTILANQMQIITFQERERKKPLQVPFEQARWSNHWWNHSSVNTSTCLCVCVCTFRNCCLYRSALFIYVHVCIWIRETIRGLCQVGSLRRPLWRAIDRAPPPRPQVTHQFQARQHTQKDQQTIFPCFSNLESPTRKSTTTATAAAEHNT